VLRTYLAYVKSSRPTGKFMARQLGIQSCGMNAPVETLDFLLRWGSRKPMPSAGIELNNATAIRNASDKLLAYSILKKAGLRTVFMTPDFDEARRNSHGIVFGRNRSGFGGKDIVVYRGDERPSRHHDFYTPWLDAPREVRIHVVRDKVVRVQGKYLDFPEKAGENLIKNYAHGYRFRSPKQELHHRRRNDAILAVQSLGLDFGAVDMLIWGDRDHYILEVNTAPACSPLTARCYAGEIALQVERQSSGGIRLAPSVLATEMDYIDEEGD
jgi:hypothetical protein